MQISAIVLAAAFLTLAERGQSPRMSIVVPEGSEATVRYAAEELRDHVVRMTDVTLPIVSESTGRAARIGLVDDSQLGTDGFRLRVQDGDLVVEGGRRGVLYGVYELLETYGGCGWFSSRTTVVPVRDDFAVPADLDRTERPAFRVRELLWYDTRNSDFAARLRLNANFHLPEERHGGNEYRFGGGLGNCHTFAKLVPVDEYFDAHPEYFSEVGGRRIRENTQLCLTNPDVLRIVTEKVLAAIEGDPEARYFGVSQNDWQGFCTCANCKAVDDEEGSHAGTMIRFVNAVADEVAKTHSDKIIETLAYQYTRKPPKKTRPRDNVMVCLCTIECDFSTPIATGTYEGNVSVRDDVRGWSELTDNLYIWDYTTNFKSYLQPFPNLDVLQPNLKFFRDNGVVSILEQGDNQGAHAESAELKAWLLAKLMWNPDQPVEPLVRRFLDAYYGAAAPLVGRYLEELHGLQRLRAEAGGVLSIFEVPGTSVCGRDFLERSAAVWQEAEETVAGSAELAYNVRMGALPVMYMLFMSQERKFRVPGAAGIPSNEGFGSGTLAEWIEATFVASRAPIAVSETDGETARLRERLRTVAASGDTAGAKDLLVIPVDRLREKGLVNASGSVTGRALAPPNSGYDWYVLLQFGDVAYDADAEYRVLLRTKVDLTAGGPDGEAFWAGVYDNARVTELATVAKKASECGEDWEWCEVATMKLSDSLCLWVGSGRFDRGTMVCNPSVDQVYFDAVELIRTDAFWNPATYKTIMPNEKSSVLERFSGLSVTCGYGGVEAFDSSVWTLHRSNALRVFRSIPPKGFGVHVR